MTHFEGDIVEDKKKTNSTKDISDEVGMFQNCSVSIKNLDEHIDSTTSSTYAYDPEIFHE